MSHIRHIQEEVLTHLEHTQASHKTVVDRHRLPHNFQKGDLVWLLRRHVRTTRPCDKLDHQRLGPFRIAAQINDVAFRLDLPSHMRLHPVFHCSLLEPCATTTIPHRIVPPPPINLLIDQNMRLQLSLIPRSSAISYITWWIGLDTILMIILGSSSTTLLMLKHLWMPSIASIRKNLAFHPWQLVALVVLRGGLCHEY